MNLNNINLKTYELRHIEITKLLFPIVIGLENIFFILGQMFGFYVNLFQAFCLFIKISTFLLPNKYAHQLAIAMNMVKFW